MSKNFELLQRAGKFESFSARAEPVRLPQKKADEASFRKAPQIDAEITKLVQRLFSQTSDIVGPKMVSFSGIARDDRSSWICARSAEGLAEQSNGTVCVVDANLRSPQLHNHFAVANHFGLTEALSRKGPIRDFAIPMGGDNLWLIPSGAVRPGNHPAMEHYRERFDELRETFDHILVSAPAFSRETDATSLGQLADGVVLIVEANCSRRETVRRAKEQLESAHVRLLGAVLDQRTFPIPEKLYRRL